MSADKFFPPRPNSKPTIYAYEDTNPQYRGLLKIGYTTVDAKSRVAQQNNMSMTSTRNNNVSMFAHFVDTFSGLGPRTYLIRVAVFEGK